MYDWLTSRQVTHKILWATDHEFPPTHALWLGNASSRVRMRGSSLLFTSLAKSLSGVYTLFLQNRSLIKHYIVKSNNTTIITQLAVCNPQEKANSYERRSPRHHPVILKLPVSDNNAVTEKTNPKRWLEAHVVKFARRVLWSTARQGPSYTYIYARRAHFR